MIPKLALEDVSIQTVRDMGFLNIIWLFVLAVGYIAWRAKKIGVTSIGKNEWGMLEIFGFPLVPVFFGIFPFVKGVFHVKEVSTAPERVDFSLRQEVNDRVLGVAITVRVKVTEKVDGNPWMKFVNLRRDLIAALYGAYDPNVTDAENPERRNQTRDMLEAGTRSILREHNDITKVTMEEIKSKCGDELQETFGEYIVAVYVREDAPVDGQLWKEGRGPVPDSTVWDDAPAAPVIGIASHTTG